MYTVGPALAACPGPPTMCVCSYSLPLWEPAAGPHSWCVHTTSHHCCLPWSLASESGGSAEDPNSPCSLYRLPTALAKGHAVVDDVDTNGLSP